MAGMLLGGIAWGMLGDKKGRLSVLFGSILLYSLANIANGFVQSIEQYAVLRFVAGIGLAGELGAGITLVAELLPREHRGYGTTIITSVGVSGALLAWLIAKEFGWQTCYFIGGGLGLVLLFLRIGLLESGMYEKATKHAARRGSFVSLFTNKERFARYMRCILIGLPTWYLVGILMTLSPEISKALHVQGEILGGTSIFWFYLGLTFGDLTSGVLSQYLRSRKKVVLLFLLGCSVLVGIYFLQNGATATQFYAICTEMGFTSGYWALFVTIGAEQFGTNLRATVATTVPNFARGALVLISLLFQALRTTIGSSYGAASGILYSGMIVGALCLAIAIFALSGLHETFGKDLDYVEA
jgi:MFS family permease